LQQLLRDLPVRRHLPNDFRGADPGHSAVPGRGRGGPDRLQLGLVGARVLSIRRDDLERRMADWGPEEPALFIGNLEEPACPTPSSILDLGSGQLAHDRQRLIARSRSVPQLDAFLVRQEASSPEPEMEEIARHVCSPSNSDLQRPVRFLFTPEIATSWFNGNSMPHSSLFDQRLVGNLFVFEAPSLARTCARRTASAGCEVLFHGSRRRGRNPDVEGMEREHRGTLSPFHAAAALASKGRSTAPT
jgi:hypothetical protein